MTVEGYRIPCRWVFRRSVFEGGRIEFRFRWYQVYLGWWVRFVLVSNRFTFRVRGMVNRVKFSCCFFFNLFSCFRGPQWCYPSRQYLLLHLKRNYFSFRFRRYPSIFSSFYPWRPQPDPNSRDSSLFSSSTHFQWLRDPSEPRHFLVR